VKGKNYHVRTVLSSPSSTWLNREFVLPGSRFNFDPCSSILAMDEVCCIDEADKLPRKPFLACVSSSSSCLSRSHFLNAPEICSPRFFASSDARGKLRTAAIAQGKSVFCSYRFKITISPNAPAKARRPRRPISPCRRGIARYGRYRQLGKLARNSRDKLMAKL
jgi:hypothetical protein